MVTGILRVYQLSRYLPCRTRQSRFRSEQSRCVIQTSTALTIHVHPETELGENFLPIFISVDPARDTPERISRYLADFHPSFVGLVGPYDVTKAACKAYRVYFSTPPNADPKGDYLVDHSIFVYLMDPEGQFVEAFGQTVEVEQIVTKIKEEVADWEKTNGEKTSVRG